MAFAEMVQKRPNLTVLRLDPYVLVADDPSFARRRRRNTPLMKLLFMQALVMCANFATAQTFSTIEGYLANLTTGQQIVGKEMKSFDHKIVFGTVRWRLPEYDPEAQSSELGSIFVLERLQGNDFREVVRSTRFAFSPNSGVVFDGLEVQSSSKFFVNVFHTRPLGTIKYRFAKLRQTWMLSGRDDMFCYHSDDDEAQCDTRVERSTNFLTGKVSEKQFRLTRLVSTRYEKSKFPKFPLTEFRLFDPKHGEL